MSETLLKRRRSRFRFGLRTLMVLITVIASLMAWVANERRRSQFELQFAEQLRNQGFTNVAFGGPYDSFGQRSLGRPQSWWRNLARQILGEKIVFSGDPKPDFENWQEFAELSNLQSLCLDHTQISDLTPLASFKNLRWLSLNDTSVNDLRPLMGLTNLQELYIASTQISDLTPLTRLTDLKYLSVGGAQVRNLTPLARLTNLQVLYAHGLSVDMEQVAAIQEALPSCKIQHSRP